MKKLVVRFDFNKFCLIAIIRTKVVQMYQRREREGNTNYYVWKNEWKIQYKIDKINQY